MNPVKVTFLVDEERGILRQRAEAFMRGLEGPFHTDLMVKERYPGGGLARVVRILRDLLLSKPGPDILYVVDIGFTGVLVAAVFGVLRKTTVFIDTGDLYAELHRESGRFGPVGIGLRRFIERLALSRASQIIVRGRLHREYLSGMGYHEVQWIPDGIDASRDRSFPCTEAKRRLGVEGYFTVGVMGSAIWNPKHRLCYGWELIELMALIRDLPVRGVFIGDGDGLPYLQARARELSVSDRIVFVGRVPYASLPEFLNAMDVCITTQTNDWIGRVRTTAKLPEYMACGRYILATEVGEACRLLPPGMLVPFRGKKDPRYPARLAQRIRALVADPEGLGLGEKLKPLAAEHFDYEVLAKRLGSVFLSALGRA